MIFTEYPHNFWHKRKMDNFDPYDVLLAIATDIPVTGFVVHGHGHICATKFVMS